MAIYYFDAFDSETDEKVVESIPVQADNAFEAESRLLQEIDLADSGFDFYISKVNYDVAS